MELDRKAGNSKWKNAVQLEHDTLLERGTWIYVRLDSVPKGATILRSVWSFKVKLEDGIVQKYKARGCVDGGRQREGVDYWESYAPTANATFVRILLAIAAE